MNFDCVLCLLVGFVLAMLLTAYVCYLDRKKLQRQHNEAMVLAKEELDEARSELMVKQNILNSLSDKVARQQRTIEKMKRIAKENDTRRENNRRKGE